MTDPSQSREHESVAPAPGWERTAWGHLQTSSSREAAPRATCIWWDVPLVPLAAALPHLHPHPHPHGGSEGKSSDDGAAGTRSPGRGLGTRAPIGKSIWRETVPQSYGSRCLVVCL